MVKLVDTFRFLSSFPEAERPFLIPGRCFGFPNTSISTLLSVGLNASARLGPGHREKLSCGLGAPHLFYRSFLVPCRVMFIIIYDRSQDRYRYPHDTTRRWSC